MLLQYEDDEGDRVLLTTDTDLAGAVLHAKSSGLKVFCILFGAGSSTIRCLLSPTHQSENYCQVLKLHIEDESSSNTEVVKPLQELAPPRRSGLSPVKFGLMAGAVALSGAAVMVYLKRSRV